MTMQPPDTMDDYNDECPYCDGEGWMPDECDCMEGCVACVEPSGMPCDHCRPQNVDNGLQQVLADALEKETKP